MLNVKLIASKYLPEFIDTFICDFLICFASSDTICVANTKLCEAKIVSFFFYYTIQSMLFVPSRKNL